ncbi:hypothetical protein Psuf_077520 [Phytohabitans suffuscus]|uniref:Uncharacterized protein n=1 Tax=Phytohabitans suffuscus TaxID=624315 RepID=A0A6F8YWI1_9ACTN|nr:hypothetical protein [Phytohabitans suffuscus]BCB90439.1 hypothetical protein Psuf_077520 [Phytohabitans suffuscus]
MLAQGVPSPTGAGRVPLHVWASWMTGAVKALATAVSHIDEETRKQLQKDLEAISQQIDGVPGEVLAAVGAAETPSRSPPACARSWASAPPRSARCWSTADPAGRSAPGPGAAVDRSGGSLVEGDLRGELAVGADLAFGADQAEGDGVRDVGAGAGNA